MSERGERTNRHSANEPHAALPATREGSMNERSERIGQFGADTPGGVGEHREEVA